MTDTDTTAKAGGPENLAALRMAELREIASSKGIRGISAMRKHELIEAIKNGAPAAGTAPARKTRARKAAAPKGDADSTAKDAKDSTSQSAKRNDHGDVSDKSAEASNDKAKDKGSDKGSDKPDDGKPEGREEMSRSQQRRNRRNRARQREQENNEHRDNRDDSDNRDDRDTRDNRDNRDNRDDHKDRDDRDNRNNRNNDRGDRNNKNDRNNDRHNDGDNRNRRGRRNRRDRRGRDNHGGGHGGQDEIREDDVLQPVAGIVDLLDNKSAFVRTSGYLPGSNDVLVSAQMVRKYGLRKGDAITGRVRMPRENGSGQVTHGNGRNRRKYNPLVKVESVNGLDPEQAKQRREFSKLTPLYPNRRLRLETEQKILTTRVIDLIMPIGKGQRALIVSPPKAGKTTILQNIANAIATNNPECYMMVVLVDERPEEVTDMQRSVRGEVIASTFDRPPSDHTAVAELAIERAKRLVEQGQDVVVLLDSITRLGRAYNNSSPASGRILSGGVDSNALYPPKRFLGAARNIEEGGSLTIIATAMVETGSAGDTVIFEEFKGTGNAELKLDRKISERRVFPAVDVNPSGTRKDELLLAPDEARVMHKLRRILSALESQAAIDLLIKQLKKTRNNQEFLMQVASSAPMAADVDVDDML